VKSSNKGERGTREIMAGIKILPFHSRPVWCHDCNLGQHSAPIKEVDAYGAKL